MLSHKPHKMERSQTELSLRSSLSNNKSRLPVKSETARLKDRATSSHGRGLRKVSSPVTGSDDVHQETKTAARGVETASQPVDSSYSRPVSPVRQYLVSEDARAKLRRPQGLAIRHSTVNHQEDEYSRVRNSTNPLMDNHLAGGLMSPQKVQNDSPQFQAKRANVPHNQLPSSSPQHPEDFFEPTQPPSPTMTSSRQDAGTSGRIIPELRSLMSVAKSDYVHTTTPNVPSTATPSTRYTESPSVWSSRNTTPISVSSYSPGLLQSVSSDSKFSSPKSGQPAPWFRKPRNAVSPELLDPSNQPIWNETTISGRTVATTPSPSLAVERLHLRKKRAKTGDPSPITPPPRKSSTKFSSPHKSVKESKKPAKTARSGDASVTPREGATKVTKEKQYQQKPERPSREGVVFLSENHMSPATKGAGRFPSNPITSSTTQSPGPSESQLERGQPFQHTTGRSVPNIDSYRGFLDRNSERAAARVGSKTSLANSENSENSENFYHGIGEQQANQSDPVDSPRHAKIEKKSSRFGFWDKKMRSKDKASRGRRLSIGGAQNPRGVSTSTSNSASASVTSLRTNASSGAESDMDEFLSQRLEPIILRGGGGPLGSHPNSSSDRHTHKPEPDHDGSRRARQPLIASSIADYQSPQKATTDLAPPTNQSATTDFSSLQNKSHPTSAGEIGGVNESPRPAIQDKKPKASRWKIFAKNRKPFSALTEAGVTPKMSVAISPVPDARPLAFYAMDDLESDIEDFGSFNDMADQGHRLSRTSADYDRSFQEAPRRQLRRQQGFSVLLPSPPVRFSEFVDSQRPPSPRVVFQPEDTTKLANQNTLPDFEYKSRPKQVGDSPIVSSVHPQQLTSSVKSFSRPFGLDSSLRPETSSSLNPRNQGYPSFSGIETEMNHLRRSQTAPPHHIELEQSVYEHDIWDPSKGHGLFDYSPKTASEIPAPLTPKTHSHATTGARIRQDEVWNEFDDLIDHVLSPVTGLKAPDVSFSQAEQLPGHSMTGNGYESKFMAEIPAPLRLGSVEPASTTGSDSLFPFYSQGSDTFIPSSPLQAPSTAIPSLISPKSSESVRLRRSRINSALRSSTTPSEPASYHDLPEMGEHASYSIFHERDLEYVDQQDRDSSSILDLDNIPETPKTLSHQVNTTMLDIAERDRDGPIALSNLRYGALMTSRWLSFGRVLFSPAHDRLQSSVNDHILVIDGLGNDDWSFYCALTYPKATTYNLSGRDPFLTERPNHGDWKAPVNHRNVNHANSMEPFPFPRSFFAVVVFRYPAAMSEQVLKKAISECKRVLQPGGYIELSVIELDMVNMGNRTRRAIRMLKTRMSVADPNVCLKPTVDNIQRLIGRRGFENLNRCIVGLPVAGAVGSLGSESSRASYGSSGDRFSDTSVVTASPHPSRSTKSINRARMSDQNFSLSDLLADHSSAGDEKLADVIAKVGRYFFSRCYEWAVLPNGDLERSIWSDRGVLRECERRGSGFKLMIAYAQNSVENRRRTLSEPTKPTPAVMGTTMMKEYDRVMRR